MDLEKDIYVALSIINGKEDINKLGNYNLVYRNSNENLGEYFKHFPIKNGNVLTILSSGDQVLQSVYCGAKNIYTFDYNPLAIYMGKLKISSLYHLDYNSFMNYFNNYDISYYKKIRDYLDDNTRLFWDKIYKNIKYRNQFDHFIQLGNNYNSKESYSYYNNYYETQNKIDNVSINYYCTDVYDILNFLPSNIKLDAVFLSNIFDWMNLKNKVRYPLFIKKELFNYMNDDGMIAVYSSVNGYKDTPLDIIFNDYINVDSKNKVLVYKK